MLEGEYEDDVGDDEEKDGKRGKGDDLFVEILLLYSYFHSLLLHYCSRLN